MTLSRVDDENLDRSFVCFVTGHDFSRADFRGKRSWALAPAMAIPGRKSSSENILNPARTFFTTSKTSMGRGLLQSERSAELLIDVLRSLVVERAFTLHDFVIMPDHLHLLLTVHDGMTVEKAMQLVKGRFSFRLGRESDFKGDIWQRGFSEVQVLGDASFREHRVYIANNPAKAGLVHGSEKYPYCFVSLAERKAEERVHAATEN